MAKNLGNLRTHIRIDTYNVFHQLRSVTSNSFGGLEYVNFTVLDNLFDAGISSTIHTSPRLAIAARETEI